MSTESAGHFQAMADGPVWRVPRAKEYNTGCNQRGRLGETNEVLEYQNKELEVDVHRSDSFLPPL